MTVMEEAATRLEREHVHSVYEKIAPYFNDSRYKAWPKVRQFLLEHEPGSIIADVGCGNGKYLHINGSVFKLGCDVCRPLVDSAWSQGHEVQLCDCLRLPYRDSCFDGVLSIAVIHHLSTKERRIRAIKEMARTLRVGGRIMIYVWAMEQTRRKFQKQDIFVPWNPNPPSPTLDRERPTPRRRGAAQSVSECLYSDNKDEHRKVKSTSFMLDEEEIACSPQQSQRLWFFSRSLDSVFDFGSLTISRSTSRELISTFSSRLGEGGKVGRRGRGAGLIKQVSSLFSGLSRNSSEEDVFDSATDLVKSQRDHGVCSNDNHSPSTEMTSVSTALVQECGSVALPDLVSSYQMEHTEGPGQPGERDAGPPGDLKQGQNSSQCPQDSEGEPAAASCLRYYHVFREGELAELIESHVEELHVLYSCSDHANWCVVAEKVQVWKV
ncbi:probable tRNA methyltransferase 9B isoform X1 [Coregonus clupeaformis]|uniref:probable tRNA methyltransferase 9B isoform X1 n=1 Tax=Coregonus clupeaformis TaxID=59861 RepID=UPI001E1C90EC|nr:probable tRNA methyltransferase 9B isoform X1 [Coregonus clupeaformis]XP_041733141.2 probable tRNA methyltransferase 9B isoform X1 [Coregonus clupeaformis]XP_041733142.2 probable tRNA methyltransferase 9B isoform X1 [Coregonus clupeaformis]